MAVFFSQPPSARYRPENKAKRFKLTAACFKKATQRLSQADPEEWSVVRRQLEECVTAAKSAASRTVAQLTTVQHGDILAFHEYRAVSTFIAFGPPNHMLLVPTITGDVLAVAQMFSDAPIGYFNLADEYLESRLIDPVRLWGDLSKLKNASVHAPPSGSTFPSPLAAGGNAEDAVRQQIQVKQHELAEPSATPAAATAAGGPDESMKEYDHRRARGPIARFFPQSYFTWLEERDIVWPQSIDRDPEDDAGPIGFMARYLYFELRRDRLGARLHDHSHFDGVNEEALALSDAELIGSDRSGAIQTMAFASPSCFLMIKLWRTFADAYDRMKVMIPSLSG